VRARAVNKVGDGGWSKIAMKTPTDSAIRTSANMAADVSLSTALNEIIASEKPALYVTTGTHTVNEMGDIDVTYVPPPEGITLPTYEPLTGTMITVTAGTTAGTYLVYGIKTETDDILFAEYFYVTVSPDDAVVAGGNGDDDGGNDELIAAVDAGRTTWGETADLNYIITTAVTDMSNMFQNNATFNGDISLWDTTAVTNMFQMFASASVFNADISDWDVSSVTDMISMFAFATIFNGDISNWDVSSVTTMTTMFYTAAAFNQNLEEWKEHWTLEDTDDDPNTPSKYTGSKTNMFNNSGVTTPPTWH
ncbi:MAG: BspA family leucine-rich repeat surface protein, partial [Salinispira sp.]